MKKLVYLLVLSLCLSGMTGVSFTRMSALAEKDSEAVSNQLQSNWASGKMAPKSTDSKTKKSKSDNGKNKLSKTKVEKEKEYILDLDQNSQVHLSTILKFAKLEIKLKDIKSIEYEDKKYKKYISWEPDEDKEYDYIFTVLKNFKEIRLRIVTKKDEKLLVLQNGAKAGKGKAEKRDSGDASEQRTEDKAAPQHRQNSPQSRNNLHKRHRQITERRKKTALMKRRSPSKRLLRWSPRPFRKKQKRQQNQTRITQMKNRP